MEIFRGRRCSLSPLLIAIVFVTFFHGVLCRHRIRHYKDRFKRQQGAHLYLPGSYVTEGGTEGPDNGPWSDWSEPSPCSRSCGGGVSTQMRACQAGYTCTGPEKRHFSCNTQDCPDTADFRSQQCSEYNDVPFENVKYEWIPYTKATNPCELNCMPRGERFYYRHASAVVDGTRCNDESVDVCVNGKCQPVGCDMMLGSTAKEDECRVCGGDGSTCNTVSNTIEMRDMQVGYNDILLIPAGATNIKVEEVAPSNNYLAVRNTSGHYYLNGNWRIDFPRTMEFAGCKFHYERSPQGFSAPDRITCLGPIYEPLFIVLLFQDSTVPVDYKYSLPMNVQLGSESETYAWTFDQFSPCSTTCGGGIQYRNVSCAGRKTLEPVDSSLCDANTEPESSRKCSEIACDAQWTPHPWGKCSAPCGQGGVQTRDVSCQKIDSNGFPTLVDEKECEGRGPKPPQEQKCNQGKTCATWHLGPWKPCDHLCGDGKQTRKIQCYIKDENNKIKVLDDSECEVVEQKPEEEKSCNVRPCEGVDWITSEWSGCERVCGLKNETRKAFCASQSGQIYSDDLCEAEKKPELLRECTSTNASCEYLWYASQWSECSVKCGPGIQTRTLFCGVVTEDGVKKVETDKCDHSKQFDTMKNCTGTEKCEGEWFSGPWTECSKPCGGGEKTRKVVCLLDNLVVDPSSCDSEKIIFSQEDCNTKPCTEDSIIPTDVTKPVDESEPKTESDKTTTEMSVGSETTEETLETSESQTDLSEITKSFEITTESSKKETEEPTGGEDEEYEIVPSDECDDGEWVEGDVAVIEKEKEPATTEPTVSKSSESDTSFSLDDLMLSDGTFATETDLETGSGDIQSTVSGITEPSTAFMTEEEGSGAEATDTTESSATTTTEVSGASEASTIDSGNTQTGTEDNSQSSTVGASVSTESTTESVESTGSTMESSTGTSFSTESVGSTDGSVSTESSMSTENSSSTESTEMTTESTGSESTESTDSETTETTESSLSTETTESSLSTESTSSETTESTESTIGTETVTSSDSTESVNLESDVGAQTGVSVSEQSESSTDFSTTESTTSDFGSSTVSGSTESEGSTMSTEEFTEITASTREITESTEASGSTESTTEFTGSTESTTEFTGSTESRTEFTESTESSTEVTGSTESTTEFTGSTESTTEFTGSTETDIFSTTGVSEDTTTEFYGTTQMIEVFTKKHVKMCKRRKIGGCKKTKHGCCWDKITPAKGPFDKGCPTPKTCKESKFGCCEDGVSAALGPKFRGCPATHCNETLFGCCPDNKTAAEGNDNEGCPPPPPACLKEKFGCCEDNITAAKGPDHEGCKEEILPTTTELPSTGDCAETTYGCCPDNVTIAEGEFFEGCDIFKDDCTESYFKCCPDGKTSAKGPNFRGCELSCQNTTFGCCSDNITPAHGPSGEGCCLSSTFGCCPDNIVAARGLNFEGCGCQYSPYGCCPDNSTSARGYNKEGCGCKHTEHGCCPDDYTPAYGPGYEGCLCHTFQFGCCPDGVSAARGPHQQGCGCRNTEFGCCSDEETPALGPNQQGCGCQSSKYGCCLDGVSEAKGDKFEGCEEIPADLQDSCSLPKERGACRNYTVKWFFDMDYGGCSRFWYGGCDGNENRYKTKEECDQICVEPKGTDRCNLPKVAGPCEGYYQHWYYDKEAKHCAPFVYGGCLGNNNRFETREECMELCVKDDSVDACEQPKEEGPCRGQYSRYYFNKEADRCEEFRYGGCKGNNNNFLTIEACNQKCATPGRKKDHCSLPRAQGNCTEKLPRWYHDTPEKRCLPFYYSGCNGNQNNFESKEACENDCPVEIVKDICHLPAETGDCADYVDRWYFDTKEKSCRQFYYGGCGGNGNNFETEHQCKHRCEAPPAPQQVPEVSEPQPQPPPTYVEPSEPFGTEMCFLPVDSGPCREPTARVYYDKIDGVCKSFTYGGCEGNRNNFKSLEECFQNCGSAQDLCTLPPVVGPCDGEYLQYYYEPSTDSCKEFNFGGCEGNYNRFHDKASCEQRCRKAPPSSGVVTQPPVLPPSDVATCYEDVDPGNCSDSVTAFFYDKTTGVCTPFSYSGCGGNGNRFNSEEQCERQCGTFRGQDVCNLDKDAGPCRAYFVKYYYDRAARRCSEFVYGGCQGNGNRFSSSEECESVCLTHEEAKPNITSTAICLLPIDQGSCQEAYHKRWYFDHERGECVPFIYTGCGGNFNNFKTFQSCIDFCHEYLPQTEPPAPMVPTQFPPHECQAVFDECSTMMCPYGVEAYIDENDCNRCQCRDPCKNVECGPGTQCAIDLNRNKTSSQDADFVAICRESNKPGQCPNLEQSQTNCERECNNDADCTLHLKCCSTSCGTSCVEPFRVPGELVTQQPLPGYTDRPDELEFVPPKVDELVFEPEVSGLIGDQAVLNCAVLGNPNPKITWTKDGHLIDGTQPRYRIRLDQTLQIITLHKTDSGIYLCTADNRIGTPIVNQIKLDVLDSDPRQATIMDPEDQQLLRDQIVSLNAPTTLNCYALGYPFPAVTWWKDDSMIPLKNNEFEVRKDYSLLIHSVQLHNLGVYTCQAYNGIGKAASWSVTVKARGPFLSTHPDDVKYLRYIVEGPDGGVVVTRPPPPPPQPRPTPYSPVYPVVNRQTPPVYLPPVYPDENLNEVVPEVHSEPPAAAVVPPHSYIVPLRANITTNDQRYPTGSDIELPCEVVGFPEPQVQWYKDGVPVYPSDRISVSDLHTLSIRNAQKSDSGAYQCEATNSYSKASSTLEILVEGMYIHPSCTDNQFFANCALIVREKYCNHKYYAKFCCRSCTEAGLLPVDGPHLSQASKQSALSDNLV